MINSNIAVKQATIVIFCGALGLAQNNHFDYTCPYKAFSRCWSSYSTNCCITSQYINFKLSSVMLTNGHPRKQVFFKLGHMVCGLWLVNFDQFCLFHFLSQWSNINGCQSVTDGCKLKSQPLRLSSRLSSCVTEKQNVTVLSFSL